MEAIALIERAKQAGLKMKVSGDSLEVEGKPTPEVLTIVQELKEHKAEVMDLLKKPELVEGQPPKWHADEIAKLVEIEGQAVFWSTIFNEMVAFVKDESYMALIPAGVVIYTIAEIEKLCSSGSVPSKETLHRIHEEKKLLKARLIDYQQDWYANLGQ